MECHFEYGRCGDQMKTNTRNFEFLKIPQHIKKPSTIPQSNPHIIIPRILGQGISFLDSLMVRQEISVPKKYQFNNIYDFCAQKITNLKFLGI